jgi:hypothetical protein
MHPESLVTISDGSRIKVAGIYRDPAPSRS